MLLRVIDRYVTWEKEGRGRNEIEQTLAMTKHPSNVSYRYKKLFRNYIHISTCLGSHNWNAMTIQKAIWQRALGRSHISKPARKYSSFRQRRREPFILPRLVIDLDSSENKYVRLEKAFEEEQRSAESCNEEVYAPEQSIRLRGWWNNGPLDTRITTPDDILTYALNGDSVRRQHPPTASLHDLIDKLRISPSSRLDQKIPELLHGFSAHPSVNLKAAGFEPKNKADICFQLEKRYKSWPLFRRAISMLSSTTEGCRFLAANGAALTSGLLTISATESYFDEADTSNQKRSLLLLNNLYLNMESKGVEIGPQLCSAGLYFSMRSGELPSMMMYRHIMVKNGYSVSRRLLTLLHKFTQRIMLGSTTRTRPNDVTDINIKCRRTLLSFLSGFEGEEVPCPVEKRSPSFEALLEPYPKIQYLLASYPAYIIALGVLGESDALLREFKGLEASSVPQLPGSGEYLANKAHVFAVAFAMTGDMENAAAALRDGIIHGNEELEKEIMQSAILTVYRLYSVRRSTAFADKVRAYTSRNSETALDFIKRAIDFNALSQYDFTKKRQYFVDWVESRDEVENKDVPGRSNDNIGRAVVREYLKV